uniref:Uncharacterized protein n=1 Tax=Rhizophora mucronata TaxID=61149 RepID=A0A2P2J437_RHIMU
MIRRDPMIWSLQQRRPGDLMIRSLQQLWKACNIVRTRIAERFQA